ncbi:hypothetical protein scyTo_0027386, partial [Scyliorhinus torazame]|nr:hypothetical protein [Scyliorhinus torazame]
MIDSDNVEPPTDVRTLLENILELLKPGETVAKAIRRLGGDTAKAGSAKRPWKTKRRKRAGGHGGEEEAEGEEEVDEVQEEERLRTERLDRLTGLADQMVAWGEYEIYQDTYEKIRYRLKKATPQPAKPAAPADPLDMFAEQIDDNLLKAKEETLAEA